MTKLGTVLEVTGNKALVYTIDNEIISIKRKNAIVGEQVTFQKSERTPWMGKPRVKTVILPLLAVAAAVALMLFTFRDFLILSPAGTPAGYVAVDINPSVQLDIDEACLVIGSHSYNEDGTTLLSSVDLTGKTVEEAVQLLIGSAQKLGFLKEGSKVVLVSGAAGESTSSDTGYQSKLKTILSGLQGDEDTDLFAVFVERKDVVANAQKNKLTIGRELLLEYAQQNNIGLSADDIRTGNIGELLGSLDNPQELTEEQSSSESSSSAASQAASSQVSTPEPTQKGFSPYMSASQYGTSIKIAWTPVPGTSVTYNGKNYTGFKFYKVVASNTTSSPRYPDNGYLTAISSYSTSSWIVDPSGSGYNKSPQLQPDTAYYFSVTYVFENGSLYANSKQVTVPHYSAPTPVSFSGPSMTASLSGSNINVSWTPLSGDTVSYGGITYSDFLYYKVVASETNSTPQYSADGYLLAQSNIGTSSWSFDPLGSGYNKNPTLLSGHQYYFGVTYVFADGKKLYAYSGGKITIPTGGTPTAFSGPSLSASYSGGALHFNWATVPATTVSYGGSTYSGFNGYKVVMSTSPNPKYPENGYLTYITDRITGTWDYDVSSLSSGTTTYFSITYLFGDGKLYADDYVFLKP